MCINIHFHLLIIHFTIFATCYCKGWGASPFPQPFRRAYTLIAIRYTGRPFGVRSTSRSNKTTAGATCAV